MADSGRGRGGFGRGRGDRGRGGRRGPRRGAKRDDEKEWYVRPAALRSRCDGKLTDRSPCTGPP
jgi:small subunit ribosomal protein S2e